MKKLRAMDDLNVIPEARALAYRCIRLNKHIKIQERLADITVKHLHKSNTLQTLYIHKKREELHLKECEAKINAYMLELRKSPLQSSVRTRQPSEEKLLIEEEQQQLLLSKEKTLVKEQQQQQPPQQQLLLSKEKILITEQQQGPSKEKIVQNLYEPFKQTQVTTQLEASTGTTLAEEHNSILNEFAEIKHNKVDLLTKLLRNITVPLNAKKEAELLKQEVLKMRILEQKEELSKKGNLEKYNELLQPKVLLTRLEPSKLRSLTEKQVSLQKWTQDEKYKPLKKRCLVGTQGSPKMRHPENTQKPSNKSTVGKPNRLLEPVVLLRRLEPTTTISLVHKQGIKHPTGMMLAGAHNSVSDYGAVPSKSNLERNTQSQTDETCQSIGWEHNSVSDYGAVPSQSNLKRYTQSKPKVKVKRTTQSQTNETCQSIGWCYIPDSELNLTSNKFPLNKLKKWLLE